MRNQLKNIGALPPLLVMIITAVLIGLNYAGLPDQIPTKWMNGEVVHYGGKYVIWLMWGMGLLLILFINVAFRIPALRKRAFQFRVPGRKKQYHSVDEVLTPLQEVLMVGGTSFVVSLIFLFMSCSILFASHQQLFQWLVSIPLLLLGLGIGSMMWVVGRRKNL